MLLNTLKSMVRAQILPRGSNRFGQLPDTPIVVAGMFRTANGIGRAAVGCFHALQDEGMNPIAVDLSQGFNQVDHESPVPLSPMPRRLTGTAIIYANAPEIERALMILKLRRWHSWRLIGVWAWELQKVPDLWRRQANYLSEVWAPSEFVLGAFEDALDLPVKRVPHYLRIPNTEVPFRNSKYTSTAPFRALTLADGRSSFHRKNVLGAIDIFQQAFAETDPVQLVVKCRNIEIFKSIGDAIIKRASEDSRIKLVDANLTENELKSLYRRCDILLSPHRAEGFGIPLAEAMILGTVVVATAWSGNTDFMTEENSVLLPYSLQPVTDPSGIYDETGGVWAEVETSTSAILLRRLYDDQAKLEKLASNAKESMRKLMRPHLYSTALGSAAPANAR